MDAQAAAAEVARRKVNRAAGLLKEAGRDLAQMADDLDVVGSLRAHDSDSVDAARELIALGAARHGAVDVIVIARPTGRARKQHPHHGPPGAKETTNGTTNHRHQEGQGRP